MKGFKELICEFWHYYIIALTAYAIAMFDIVMGNAKGAILFFAITWIVQLLQILANFREYESLNRGFNKSREISGSYIAALQESNEGYVSLLKIAVEQIVELRK